MRPGSIKEYVVGIVFGFLLCTSPGSAASPRPSDHCSVLRRATIRRRSWTLALSRSSRVCRWDKIHMRS